MNKAENIAGAEKLVRKAGVCLETEGPTSLAD
jgi:hypothetical protein